MSPLMKQRLCERDSAREWTLSPVETDEQLARCVALQVESVENRGADIVPSPDIYAANLHRARRAAHDALVTIDVGGRTVGLLWVTVPIDQAPGDACHVNSVVVTASMRGGGLGHQVMTWLEVVAARAGFGALTLNAFPDNPRVAPFYRRLGFRIVGLDLHKPLIASDSTPAVPWLSSRPFDADTDTEIRAALAHEDSLRRAFDPVPPTRRKRPARVYFVEDRWAGLVELSLGRSRRGDPIAVFERLHVASRAAAVIEAVVADGERRARAGDAEVAYLTSWQVDGVLQQTLLARGYRIGRHKWLKPLHERAPLGAPRG